MGEKQAIEMALEIEASDRSIVVIDVFPVTGQGYAVTCRFADGKEKTFKSRHEWDTDQRVRQGHRQAWEDFLRRRGEHRHDDASLPD